MDPLQNVVWHALTGPQRTVAERHGDAVRLRPDVGVFTAVPDAPTPDDWDALRTLVGPGNIATLFRHAFDKPAGWDVVLDRPGIQLAGPDGLDDVRDDRIVELGDDDVDDMLDLVRRTEPGPFLRRTIEFGGYVGVREGGALVAMAGRRLHVDGWREVSAVCTDPAHRGRGLGARLTHAVAAGIQAGGERVFLQAWADNDPAIRLYRQLGFTHLGDPVVVMLQAPP